MRMSTTEGTEITGEDIAPSALAAKRLDIPALGEALGKAEQQKQP